MADKEDNEGEGKSFFVAVEDEERGFGHLIYKSKRFKLSELELINLIRILFVDRRNVGVGRKLLDIYNDATGYSQKTIEKLKRIGLEFGEDGKPIQSGKKDDRTI